MEVKDQEVKDNKDVKDTKDTKDKKAGMIGNPEEDLTLRAALYGVLFQSYTDMVSDEDWTSHLLSKFWQ